MEYKDQTRNLNAHKAATVARFIFGTSYASQRGGAMDFWDSLCESDKNICRDLLSEIEKKRDETEYEKAQSV